MPDPLALVIGLILIPFVYTFGRALYLEIRRYMRYGPSENRRASFPINEDAPSYEAPDEPRDGESKTGPAPGPQTKESRTP